MKLHSKQNYLTKQNEISPQRKKLPILTKVIYYCVLIFIAVYLTYFFISRAYSFSTIGYVMSEREDVVASYGGRIIETYVQQGDMLSKGAPIAKIGASKFCEPEKNSELLKTDEELIKKQRELAYLKSEIELIKEETQKQKARGKLLRALDLDAPLLSNDTIDDLKLDVEKKNIELAFTQNEIEYLSSKKNKLSSLPAPDMSPECYEETIQAPLDGQVYSAMVNANDIVNKDEPVAQISPVNANTFVYSRVNFEEYQNISTGKAVNIILPSGKKTKGIIEDIGAKYDINLPDGVDSTRASFIVLKIKPFDDITKSEWSRFDDYQVKVTGAK